MSTRAGFLVVLAAAASLSCREEKAPRPGGARLYVLFDERHGLEGGESVRFHDFEVGWVESVDIAEARVRAALSIDPKILEQLTAETTVSVGEYDSAPALFIHVLDPEAEKLADGTTVEGVDSNAELALRKASTGAAKLLDRVGASEWFERARNRLSELERELEEVDWGAKEREVREHLEEAKRRMKEAAGKTSEEAKKSLEQIQEELRGIAEELEKLGQTEEAKKLRELADRFAGK